MDVSRDLRLNIHADMMDVFAKHGEKTIHFRASPAMAELLQELMEAVVNRLETWSDQDSTVMLR
jgi:hypothetical protein